MIDLPRPSLIGVIHLPALPGSPTHQLSVDEIVERSVTDANTLRAAGFNAVIIENLGDVPLPARRICSASVATMAVVADHVRRAVDLPVGINCLRNDAESAIGIAVAVGAVFVRVNVHIGVAATDQGFIEGRADQTLRYRRSLGKRIAILADVHVKHATPVSEPDLALAAKDTAYRGLADGLIVTGPATGEPTNLADVDCVREAVPDRPVFVGSGATAKTVASILRHATGVIVGSSLKQDGDTSRPVDAQLAEMFIKAVHGDVSA